MIIEYLKFGERLKRTIHYFDYIVNNLFPNIDETKNQDVVLKQFIDYYNKKLSE